MRSRRSFGTEFRNACLKQSDRPHNRRSLGEVPESVLGGNVLAAPVEHSRAAWPTSAAPAMVPRWQSCASSKASSATSIISKRRKPLMVVSCPAPPALSSSPVSETNAIDLARPKSRTCEGRSSNRSPRGNSSPNSINKFAPHHLAIVAASWFQAQQIRFAGQHSDCDMPSAGYSLPVVLVKEGERGEEIRLCGTKTYRPGSNNIASVIFLRFGSSFDKQRRQTCRRCKNCRT